MVHKINILKFRLLWATLLCSTFLQAFDSIDLSTQDIYIKKGFEKGWVNQNPKSEDGWRHIAGDPSGERSLSIRRLKLSGVETHTFLSLKNPPAESFTFLIPIDLNESQISSPEALGLYLIGIAYNWEIFFNGVSIERKIFPITNGHLDKPIRGKQRIIPIPKNLLKKGENILTLHIMGSPAYLGTGLYYSGPYLLGPMSGFLEKRLPLFQYGLVWFYFTLGTFWLYMFLRISGKINYLFFTGWTYCVSMYNLSRVDFLTQWLNTGIFTFKMEHFSIFLSTFFFIAFIEHILFKKLTHYALYGMYYFGGLAFLTIWTPVSFMNDLLWVWEVSVLIPIVYLTYQVIRHFFISLKEDAKDNDFLRYIFFSQTGNLFLGVIILFSLLVIDIFFKFFYFENSYSFLNITGSLFFALAVSGAVFKNFINAHLETSSFNEALEKEVQRKTKEITETKNQIETIFNTASSGLALFDPQMVLIECNEAYLDLFGYTFEEYKKLDLDDFYSKKEKEKILEFRKTSIPSRTKSIEIYVKRKDGKSFLAIIYASHLMDDQKLLKGFVVAIRDITKERQAEIELRKISEELMGIFHAIPDLFFRLNQKGEIINYKADNLEDLYEYPEDFLGKKLTDILPPDVGEKLMAGVEATLSSHELVLVEYSLAFKDEPKYYEHYEARMLPVPNQEVLAIVRNITQNVEAKNTIQFHREQLKRLSQKSLQALEDERARISRELHDEVGQALSAVNLNLQRIKLEIDQKDINAQKNIDDCQLLVQTTADSIHQFSFELRPSILDDLGLISAMNAHARGFTNQTKLEINLKKDASINISDDHIKITLYRIFQECLNNVAKHANASKVDVMLKMESNNICMHIKDDGVGFKTSEIQDTILLKGLGITGMKERVDYVDGTFLIHSEPNIGTEITINIPCNKTGVSHDK
ncbi:MAG: PAS domain S-box protein [Candidatus Marinimicrobia bacterium]|nr:PAS domain S-box protein [Candidatus Neomarinimicrobiota bacterium]